MKKQTRRSHMVFVGADHVFDHFVRQFDPDHNSEFRKYQDEAIALRIVRICLWSSLLHPSQESLGGPDLVKIVEALIATPPSLLVINGTMV